MLHFSLLAPGVGPVLAADVGLVGLFRDRAVLVIDLAPPRTLTVGGPAVQGVKLLAVEEGAAIVEVDGRRQRLAMGERIYSAASAPGSGEVNLTADASGQFLVPGSINGAPVRFLVDTGATLVSLSARDALRAGVNYRGGDPGISETANGPAHVWHVKLDRVTLGGITLTNVDGLVHATDMPFVLLGMSFLNRMEMKRDGNTMTLRRRY
ncbi:MAG: TIGR02281 family clan AA aspartic protease [Rhodocyclaceae bacterium]|nr:TIGR02281 family clan AA aspartic protease [Rhodocyclaceae bacterium]